jgi:hypothetical protein
MNAGAGVKLRIKRLFTVMLMGCSLVISSCASTEKAAKPIKGTEDSEEGPTFLVGLIEFINPEQQFVLIKTQPGISLKTGDQLTALDATGSLSQLTVTPERKGSHITADISGGNPRVGNLVAYQPKQQKVADSPESDAPTPGPTAADTSPRIEWRDSFFEEVPSAPLPSLPPALPPASEQPLIPLQDPKLEPVLDPARPN